MIVTHFTSVHPWFDTRIFYKMARSLAKCDHEVHLVFASIHPQSESRPENVFLHPVIVEDCSRIKRMITVTWRVYKKALATHADLYHFHDPELIPFGLLLKIRGKRVIYDAHEDYPLSILADRDYIPKFLRYLFSQAMALLESLASYALDAVVVATPRIARNFKSKTVEIIQNFPDVEFYVGRECSSFFSSFSSYLVYVGSISKNRGLFEMLDAINLLKHGSNVALVMAGTFSPPSLRLIAETHEGWNKTVYVGQVSHNRVSCLNQNATAGLLLLHPTANHLESQPVKLFEYMLAGIPIVASNFPLWRKMINDSNCGLLADPLDPEDISEKIQWLLKHPQKAKEMGKRGKKAVIEKYNWSNEFAKLASLYKSLV